MFISASSHPEARRLHVFDADTGARLDNVIEIDTEQGVAACMLLGHGEDAQANGNGRVHERLGDNFFVYERPGTYRLEAPGEDLALLLAGVAERQDVLREFLA